MALVNITGGNDLTLMEANEATSIIFDEAGPSANIIFGAVIDPALEDEIRVTVIATGFNIPKAKTNVEELKRQLSIDKIYALSHFN